MRYRIFKANFMKKVLKIAAITFAVLFALIQFIRVDRTNPPIDDKLAIDAFVAIPEDVNSILVRSCNDCHSYKTVYPWYSHVAPASWFLRDHVDHGRSHLNLSLWGTYDREKQAHMLDEICQEITVEAMPLPSYLWIHRDAVLTADDRKILCDWASAAEVKVGQNFD